MSYESDMFEQLRMPDKKDVAHAVLRTLFRYNGTINAFGDDENIVSELADEFGLDQTQRTAQLEQLYHKENRIKKSNAWYRLLFRASEFLVGKHWVTRPTDMEKLTNRKGWMLTEAGYDTVLKLLHLPNEQKEVLSVQSYEVQKIAKTITEKPCPQSYDPIETQKKTIRQTTKEIKLRQRGFRHAVVEAYNFRCAVCGLKLCVPLTQQLSQQWEVQAAHIVPHKVNGKDDIWNGIALCHLHHWAFDIGWFTIMDDFQIIPSNHVESLDQDAGLMHNIPLFERFRSSCIRIQLPSNTNCFPHYSSLLWHREHVFVK